MVAGVCDASSLDHGQMGSKLTDISQPSMVDGEFSSRPQADSIYKDDYNARLAKREVDFITFHLERSEEMINGTLHVTNPREWLQFLSRVELVRGAIMPGSLPSPASFDAASSWAAVCVCIGQRG